MIPDASERINNKILLLAKALGKERGRLGNDEVVPKTGLLDSASIMQLILWYEEEFGVSTDEEELTLDNFGTVNLMVDYLARHLRG